MTAREYLKTLSDKDLIKMARCIGGMTSVEYRKFYNENEAAAGNCIVKKYNGLSIYVRIDYDSILAELSDRLEARTLPVVNIPSAWIDGERPKDWAVTVTNVIPGMEQMLSGMSLASAEKERGKK